MADPRTEHWPVPYLSKLEGGGLSPGQSVVVKGVMLEGEEGFAINLTEGPAVEDGTALHFNARPKEGKWVLNTFGGGEWNKKEEREKLHLKAGEEFTVRIRCHDSHFEIFFNQKELTKFEYRSPLSAVNHLLITGTIQLHGVNWGGQYYSVPYQAAVEGGFKPGKKLYVSGVPEEKGVERFSINILDAQENVVFHFNPRFNEKAVVRNAKIGADWGGEEREGKFPFDKKLAFDVIIVNESYSYQVFVNGKMFCTFAHRAAPEAGTSIQIEGDIELQAVHVK
jgi:hypothetical protein